MQMRRLRSGIIALGLWARIAGAQPTPPQPLQDTAPAQAMLLDGVRAFRAEQYAAALSIFRKVESEQHPKDIGFYLGMALHHLGRHAEALAAFRAAHRSGLSEPVADYYQSVSCYRLGMLERARQGFLALVGPPRPPEQGPRLGPRLQLGAQRFLQAIEQAFSDKDAGGARPSGVLRRYEAALQNAETLFGTEGGLDVPLEWLDEAVQLLMQIPERTAQLPALRQNLLRMREGVRGKPAEADVLALWARAFGAEAL